MTCADVKVGPPVLTLVIPLHFVADHSPATPFPKGVWSATKRLATGKTVRYGYYARGEGAVALGREGAIEFAIKLGETVRKEPDRGTVTNLIWRYKQSPELAKVSPRTQADYRSLLDKIQDKFGPLTLRAMADRTMAQHIYE